MTRRLQDVFKTSWKTKNCYAGDVLKMASRYVLKTNKCLLGSWREILFGIPQDSILGLLLSNIFICLIVQKALISPIMLTTLLHAMQIKILDLLLIIQNIRHQFILNGLATTTRSKYW